MHTGATGGKHGYLCLLSVTASTLKWHIKEPIEAPLVCITEICPPLFKHNVNQIHLKQNSELLIKTHHWQGHFSIKIGKILIGRLNQAKGSWNPLYGFAAYN